MQFSFYSYHFYLEFGPGWDAFSFQSGGHQSQTRQTPKSHFGHFGFSNFERSTSNVPQASPGSGGMRGAFESAALRRRSCGVLNALHNPACTLREGIIRSMTLPTLPLALRMTPDRRKSKFFFSIFCSHFFKRILHEFCLPAGTPKTTKIGSGTEKVRSETAPDAIFVDFARRCRSESLSAPILARFFTENHA